MANTAEDANSTLGVELAPTDDYEYVSEERAKVGAILPKPFALLSMICSYVMIREVVKEHRSKQGRPMLRMLLSMAVADITFSFATFLGTWPAPSDGVQHHIEGNVGSQEFCTFQGFCLQLGLFGSVMSNAALSIYYLNVVVYRKTDRDLEKMEVFLLSTIWFLALVGAFYPIPLQLYNPDADLCSVQSVPAGCSGDDCIRGSDPLIHHMIAMLVPLLCLLVSTSIMITITCKVRQVENKSRKYGASSIGPPPSAMSFAQPSGISACSSDDFMDDAARPRERVREPKRETKIEVDRRKSQAVAIQGIFYALAFLLTYLLIYISVIRYHASGTWNDKMDHFAYGVFVPSAGTFNFIVFCRLRIMKTPEGKLLKALFCCTCLRREQDSTIRSSQRKSKQSAHNQLQQHQQQQEVRQSKSQEELDIPDIESYPRESNMKDSGSQDEGLIE